MARPSLASKRRLCNRHIRGKSGTGESDLFTRTAVAWERFAGRFDTILWRMSQRAYEKGRPKSERPIELVERSVFWIFLLGIAWVPFWYGSNVLLAWGINAVLFPGLAALYEISLLTRGKGHPVGIRNLALSAALFAVVVLWIGCQTLTWSSLVNPIWGMASEALGRPIEGSISVDRDLTTLALVRLITAASVFWIALQLCRDGERAGRFVAVLAVIGCAYAAYGLIAAKTGQLPWLKIPPAGGRVSSTFYNRNSFSAYAGVTLIALAGLILQLYQRRMPGAGEGWRLRLATFIDITGQEGAALLCGGFLTLVALLLTGSRGGITATGAGLVMLVVLARRGAGVRGGKSTAVMLLGLMLGAATLYAFGGVFAGSLEERGVTDANRMAVYVLTLRSVLDAPLVGFGYGTFADVFPMYRDGSVSVAGIWLQAHNTYLEIFQGLGLVFGALLIASVALLVLRCIKGALGRQSQMMVPQVAASAAFLLGIHSLVDFPLQIQGIALTFAALLGAGVAQSESSRLVLAD
jgi:O-antigen ligase